MCLLGLLVLASTATHAQVQTNGSLFIGDGGTFFVGSGDYAFGSGGSSETTRTGTYGKLILASGATTSGAADTHFLNGYVSRSAATAFTFPIGQTGVYAPVRITPSSTAAVDAAYLRSSAVGLSPTLDVTVGAVSTVEYWNIKGTDNAQITLTWRASSSLAAIGVETSTANLTIVGYDGSKWVKIPSAVDPLFLGTGAASSIETGSITSTTAVDLSAYEFFSLGIDATTLSNPKFKANGVVAYLNNNVIALQSSLPLTGIEVYDLTGRKILESKINNTLNSTTPFHFPTAVYIVRAKLNNGSVASFKLINKN